MPDAIEEMFAARAPWVVILSIGLMLVAGVGIGWVVSSALLRWGERLIGKKGDEDT